MGKRMPKRDLKPRTVAREGSVIHNRFMHMALAGSKLTTRHLKILDKIQSGEALVCPPSMAPGVFAIRTAAFFSERKYPISLGPFNVRKSGKVYYFDPKGFRGTTKAKRK